jgi:RimJ/RimL family protein N-acetyltransferase
MERVDRGSLPVGPPVGGEPALPPTRDTLSGRDVSLVAVDPDAHVGALFPATHGDEDREAVWTYMPYGPFTDVGEMRAWLASIAPSADPSYFTVIGRDSGSPVGVVSYLNIAPADRRIELGHIWYIPAAQRTRANTEAALLLLRRAFDELGYRRVEWKCDALNARSRAAAERLGFTFEGVFPHHMIVKGRNRDTAWFSMLAEEWPGRRAAMRRWLDAPPGEQSLGTLTADLARRARP